MKTTRTLLALLATASAALADLGKVPLYEETFNVTHDRIEFLAGAGLGVPGSGVSGTTSDRAYVAVPKTTENVRGGPTGLAIAPIAPDTLSAFTCTFWYFLDEQGPDLQVPLSTAGILFLLQERGFEVRIENQMEQPRAYVFTPGVAGPHVGWRETNRWIFAAFSWDQASNTFVIHQGTHDRPVAFMRDMTRPLPANPSLPRTDVARFPETIGNTSKTHDRPLAGRMDNLRFYDRVLTRADLETIRRADIANDPVSLK